ncbi:DNA sulfur modification protein DndB, partial [Pseudomonas asuensis]
EFRAQQVRIKGDLAEAKARQKAIKEELEKAADEFCYSFPAVRGIQAGEAFYACQIPYSILARLFIRDDDESLPVELRAQRDLLPKHADGISDYILANPSDYILPAITASVSEAMTFEPLDESGSLGMLKIPMNATNLINDGQHRRVGIEYAISKDPSLANETIAVTIYFDQGLERSQQRFSDINSNQRKPSTALSAAYDHRGPYNVWIKKLLASMPSVRSKIDYERSSVGPKSLKLWSLISFKNS